MVMHLGVSNENTGYFMDNRQLEAVVDECDLGIKMQNNLKVSKQCAQVVGTANRVLSMNYTPACESKDIIVPWYCSSSPGVLRTGMVSSFEEGYRSY